MLFYSLRCSNFLPYVPLKFKCVYFFHTAPTLSPVWLVKWVFSACGADSAKKYDRCKFSSPSSPLSLLPHWGVRGGEWRDLEGVLGGGGRMSPISYILHITKGQTLCPTYTSWEPTYFHSYSYCLVLTSFNFLSSNFLSFFLNPNTLWTKESPI